MWIRDSSYSVRTSKTRIIKWESTFVKKESLDKNDSHYNLIRNNVKKREFLLDGEQDLMVTQNDIRQVQLAKSAILSGFTTLVKKAGIDLD